MSDNRYYVKYEVLDLITSCPSLAGYATVRMDKPGVGESEGDCSKTDFEQELSGYQSAFEEMLKYDFVDPARIIVIGLSNGGGVSPLVARQHPVRGYIAASSWGRTWYEHMLEMERGRLIEEGKPPIEAEGGSHAEMMPYLTRRCPHTVNRITKAC